MNDAASYEIKSPRVLIGVLENAENERDQCLRALHQQSHEHWDYFLLSGLSNQEAHRALYRSFMGRRDEFDLFLKLDGDMVFRRNSALSEAAHYWMRHPHLGHVIFALHDWFTDSLIEGQHLFRADATWPALSDPRFVDIFPHVNGPRAKLWDAPAPLVTHSPDPSFYQAYRFGVHRALKVVQPERRHVDLGKSRSQWAILHRCKDHLHRARDPRLALVLAGADDVFARRVGGSDYDYGEVALHDRYRELKAMPEDALEKQLSTRWRSSHIPRGAFASSLGVNRYVRTRLHRVGEKIARKLRPGNDPSTFPSRH